MRVILVNKMGFDTLENSIGQALYIEETKLFHDTDNDTADAQEKANRYIQHIKKEEGPYEGWNGLTYPDFVVQEIEAE